MTMAQDIISVRQLLIEVEKSIPKEWRYPEAIVEMRDFSLRNINSFGQLQDIISNTWGIAVLSIEEIAPNDNEKVIFFKAAEVLPRAEYIQLLKKAADKVDQQTISLQQFKWAIFPSSKHLRDMWEENCIDPEIRLLAEHSKSIFTNDKSMLLFFGNIVSGTNIVQINTALMTTSTQIVHPSLVPVSSTGSLQISNSVSVEMAKAENEYPLTILEEKQTAFWLIVVYVVLIVIIGFVVFKLLHKLRKT